MPDDKPITLTLTTWQQRLLWDHLKIRGVRKIQISKIPKSDWVKYRVLSPAALEEGAVTLYLEDKQIAKMKLKLGVDFDFSALNVTRPLMESKAIEFKK